MKPLLVASLGLMALVLLLQPPAYAAVTSGTATVLPGVSYELVALATPALSSEDMGSIVSDLSAQGAEHVDFVATAGGTRVTLRKQFPGGGSIPIGTVIFGNAKLESVRRLA